MLINLTREDFINQYPPLNVLSKQHVAAMWEKPNLHLYVHIPFCTSKCGFCYYKSFAMKQYAGTVDEYLAALHSEITLYSQLPEVQSRKLRSIYFGGGTPTLLEEGQLESLITHIKSSFTLGEDVEFCCEASPGTKTTLAKLRLLKEHGVSRLSLGCQSLDDDVLRVNGRNHDARSFYVTFDQARQAGFGSINVDIMSGLISETNESWSRTLRDLISLKPENIAMYKLEIYLNSQLHRRLREQGFRLMSNREEAEMARSGYEQLLSDGYILADNFSFATDPVYYHVHRREVWKGDDMIGVGMSSHSCFRDYVYQNESSMPTYMARVRNGDIPVQRAYRVSAKEEIIQRTIFGIKNLGFSRSRFEDEFGIDIVDTFPEEFAYLADHNYITVDNASVKTTLEGALFADDIVRMFYLPDQRSLMLGHVHRPED